MKCFEVHRVRATFSKGSDDVPKSFFVAAARIDCRGDWLALVDDYGNDVAAFCRHEITGVILCDKDHDASPIAG